ncbi:tripartite tricarboxylate transporter substrate-binding protein [Variovorax sp. ZS18.2.2]|uniref:tripartite tricarboxylate transporter substrate-binding protein n=1 Tax=Variovorax sp. ZS18.2.2 TaxID=2971255 RepID=UPI0021513051|nr:tripartite tricarboxylate transporter substrate-binding protein [Variovorax sp. ZS18.2.2]MCR6480493.1 tripartite tricarboxylate transporter substrate-binding protein [Variovorax sp. ZS18.2.2]
MLNRRRFAATTAAAMGALTLPTGRAQSTNYGRVISGFPPGSSGDSVARLAANQLTLSTLNYVVENRTGAGGRLAAEYVKRATADGHTLLATPDAILTMYPHVYRNLPYAPLTDFRPIAALCKVPIALAVGPSVPADVRDMRDFARWCKANPALAAFGTSGAGSTLHFTGVMFARVTKIELTHVPYRGANLAAQDAAGGQIAACVGVLTDLMPLASGGKLRILGTSEAKRSRFTPNVPSFREQGLQEIESSTWFGLFAPAATPDAVAEALHARVVAALAQPAAAETLAVIGMEPKSMPMAAFASLLRSDTERWGTVVKQVGYTAID